MRMSVKVTALFASVVFLLSSCLREQTSLTLKDIPGNAKVTGILVINEGAEYVKGKFVSLRKPAANTEVTVKIDNDSFMNNGVGTTDYSVKTDENGYFEVVIPAVDNGVRFTMFAPSFKGEYSKITGSKEGDVIVDKLQGVYAVDGTTVHTVKPGEICDIYLEYRHSQTPGAWYFNTSVSLDVYVGKAYPAPTTVPKSDIISGRKSYKHNGEVLAADNVGVNLDVVYNDPRFNGHTERLTGTSDKNGYIRFDIPVEKVEDMVSGAVTLTLSAEEHLGTKVFTYYTWVNDYDVPTNSREDACDLAPETYTFSFYDTDCNPTYDFRFFTPAVKVIMRVNQVLNDPGILTLLDGVEGNDYYYIHRYWDLASYYAPYWGFDNFETDK